MNSTKFIHCSHKIKEFIAYIQKYLPYKIQKVIKTCRIATFLLDHPFCREENKK